MLPVLTNIDRVVSMSEAAASLGRKNADQALARAVIEVGAASAAASVGDPDAWPAAATLPAAPGGLPAGQPDAQYKPTPAPEGGFFQPTQERAASQRAASHAARPAAAARARPAPPDSLNHGKDTRRAVPDATR